jgi:hypothetical protein
MFLRNRSRIPCSQYDRKRIIIENFLPTYFDYVMSIEVDRIEEREKQFRKN